MPSNERLEEELRDKLWTRKLERCGPLGGGGCISQGFAYLIDNDDKIFVKTNESLNARVMFDGELESLRQIAATHTIRVPKPTCVIHDIKEYDDESGGNSHILKSAIVMELIAHERLGDDCARTLGRNLANLHDYNNKVLRYKKRASRWIGGQQPSVKAITEHLKSSRRRNTYYDDDRDSGEESGGESDEENQFAKHNLRIRRKKVAASNSNYSPSSSTAAAIAALEVEQAADKLQQQQLDPSANTANTAQQQNEPAYPSRFVPEPDTEAITQFGFNVPTSCGSIAQLNEWHDDWVSFYARHRLDKAIRELLSNHGDRELHEQWSQLQLKVDKFFSDFDTTTMGCSNEDDDHNNSGGGGGSGGRSSSSNRIVPALLHGDLWSGNVSQLADGSRGVIWDPASFYGHSEYDFGIARMFGGIPKAFEQGYFEILPKKKFFEKRNKLYQFFHHLNHWEHFGSGYRASSLKLIKDLNDLV